jgi:hypothetical protein
MNGVKRLISPIRPDDGKGFAGGAQAVRGGSLARRDPVLGRRGFSAPKRLKFLWGRRQVD